MAIKGFADNPQQAFTPALTDWMSIQQGELLENMKKITYEDLMQPLQEQIDSLDDDKADKDTDAVAGNFAYFDGAGNPIDSGHKDSDYEDADATILKQANVVDALDSTSTVYPLSAKQGKALQDNKFDKSAVKSTPSAPPLDTNVLSEKYVDTQLKALDARIVDVEAHVYGLRIDETTGVTTRLLDAVGMTCGAPDGVNPITSDFSNCYPWSGRVHKKVALDGTVKEQLEEGYADFDGNIMTWTPSYYYMDYRSGGYRYIYISDKKKAGFKLREGYFLGSFPVSKVGTEYRSRVGEAPKTNESYTTFITGMMAQGDGKWNMYDKLHSEFLLSVIEAGTLNHKTAYGQGIQSGMPYGSGADFKCTVSQTGANSIIIANAGATNMRVGMLMQIGTTYTDNSVAADRYITEIADYNASNKTITVDGAAFNSVSGTTTIVSWGQPVPQAQYDAMGDGSGYILQWGATTRSHVCYRGVWDLWGNVWQLYAGFMRYDGVYYGCTDPTKYAITDPRAAAGWTNLGVGAYAENGYQQIREGIALNEETIDVPILWGSVAGSGTYYSAYLYNFNSVYTGARVLLLGGAWYYESFVSLVCSVGYYTPSDSYFSIGSRLIRS